MSQSTDAPSESRTATQERRPVDAAAGSHAGQQSWWGEFRHKYGLSVGALITLVVLWQAYVTLFRPPEMFMPAPWQVLYEVWAMYDLGLLMPALWASLNAYAVGTGLAIIAGLALSILIGMSQLAQVVTMPYLWAFFAMPRVALVPLLILWFGLGYQLTIATVFLSAVVPLIIQIIEGMRTADGSLLRMATMFGASRFDTMRKVILPGTVPYMANGMRQCLSRGFIGLIVVEMLVGTEGLGVQAMRASLQFNTARLMAMIMILIAIAVLLIIVAKKIENSVSKWRETVAL